jgi:hypothetical protein
MSYQAMKWHERNFDAYYKIKQVIKERLYTVLFHLYNICKMKSYGNSKNGYQRPERK